MPRNAPQTSALLALVRLSPDSPGFAGSEHIAQMLRDPQLRGYLESWVLPHVAYAAGRPESWRGERTHLRQDAYLRYGNLRAHLAADPCEVQS